MLTYVEIPCGTLTYACNPDDECSRLNDRPGNFGTCVLTLTYDERPYEMSCVLTLTYDERPCGLTLTYDERPYEMPYERPCVLTLTYDERPYERPCVYLPTYEKPYSYLPDLPFTL